MIEAIGSQRAPPGGEAPGADVPGWGVPSWDEPGSDVPGGTGDAVAMIPV
jgi:hypothetical protein